MAHGTAQRIEEFAALFAAIMPEELSLVKELPWQSEPFVGDTTAAVFSKETGLTSLTGAIPFLQTAKTEQAKGENQLYVKSEDLAQLLWQQRALFHSYKHAAENTQYPIVGELSQAHITQITSDIPGMEAANFAIFTGAQVAAQTQKKTLIIDADPRGQFVFPLLTLTEAPKLLTENLQKPSTFKSDLSQCIVSLNKNLFYLNLQASSLRPLDDIELPRLCGFLDSEYDNLVFYSGHFRSAWLSANSHVNYAVCADSYKGELSALMRHARGFHTVLMKKGRDPYLPALAEMFSQKLPLDAWLQNPTILNTLKDFVLRIHLATRLMVGGHENLPGHLHCYTGFELYAHYTSLEGAEAERALNSLQKKLRAFYPRSAFFSARSIMKRVKNMPHRAATTVLETGSEPQLVSLLSSSELRAAAIFPAGILPALSANGLRLSACTAHGFTRLKTTASRAGFNSVLTAPRYRLVKPNALAAVMEQVQA